MEYVIRFFAGGSVKVSEYEAERIKEKLLKGNETHLIIKGNLYNLSGIFSIEKLKRTEENLPEDRRLEAPEDKPVSKERKEQIDKQIQYRFDWQKRVDLK